MECFPTGKINPLRFERGDGYAVVKKAARGLSLFPHLRKATAHTSTPCSGGSRMTFDELLAQIRELLQREQRLSYRALKVGKTARAG
jgi:hypothetical protein